jgi:hypothetical protein
MQHFWYLAHGQSRRSQLELYCGPHLVISSVLLSVPFEITWQVHAYGSALSWRVLNERSSETDCTSSSVRNIALGLPKLPGNNDASVQRSILASGLKSIFILVVGQLTILRGDRSSGEVKVQRIRTHQARV